MSGGILPRGSYLYRKEAQGGDFFRYGGMFGSERKDERKEKRLYQLG